MPETSYKAPVALFVYTRLDTLKKTVHALKQNEGAAQTELYVFSDAGKDGKTMSQVKRVRDFLRQIDGFKSVHIVERETNYYLERNIIEGVSELLSSHDRIIILEDDICTSPYFLRYMNDALEKYSCEKRVMSVSGFTNLSLDGAGQTYFTPHMTGWGWGTWKDRWMNCFEHYSSREEALAGMSREQISKLEYGGNFRCLQNLDRRPIPWDICWSINILKSNGLCLNPSKTLVRNVGLSAGTHFNLKNSRIWGLYEFDRAPSAKPVALDDIPIGEDENIEKLYADALKDHGFRYNALGKVVRRLYKHFKNQ